MARRHPEGHDAEYLRWHTLDHRPEQHRLHSVRASLRLVSTPACRAARAAGDEHFDAVDHVMTYFFTDQSGLASFNELSEALGGADRKLPLLPPVQRGVYAVSHKVASPRVKIGADVLPWWPVRGVYLLLESGAMAQPDATSDLWRRRRRRRLVRCLAGVDASLASAPAGQTITYCFLDDDPVATAKRLQPVVTARWERRGITPLLAAPFHPVVPYEWERHLP